MNEPDFQTEFVRWLGNSRGYTEHFRDPNGGTGAICDSVGTIDEHLLLIEFKITVDPSQVFYSPQRSSSIERKVCNTLKRLYEGGLVPNWPKETRPHVWIVAEVIEEKAQGELHRLLSTRSLEWRFTYEFGTWDGDAYIALEKGPLTRSDALGEEVAFPDLPWPGEHRLPRRALDELQAIAYAQGVAPLFEQFMEQAKQLGLRTKCNRNNLNLQAKHPTTSRHVNVISVWPGDSGGKGLCVAANEERLSSCFHRCGATAPAPWEQAPPCGYMGARWYLPSDSTVKEFWAWAVGRKP